MGNLHQKEGSGRNELDGRSVMRRLILDVKMCINVPLKKMFHSLHLKKKGGLWACYSSKTVHASDNVHTGQPKMDMFVAEVKNTAGKLPGNMKNRNLDSCEKIDVDIGMRLPAIMRGSQARYSMGVPLVFRKLLKNRRGSKIPKSVCLS